MLLGGDLLTQCSVRFSHNMELEIQRKADCEGISFSEWVRRAVLEVYPNG